MTEYIHCPPAMVSIDDFREIYDRIQQEGLNDILFHDGTVTTVEDFLAVVYSPASLFFVIKRHSDLKPVAIWWLNRLTKTHAWCHFCAFKEMWGSEDTVPLGKEAMRICFEELGFKVIMGMIPTWNQFAIGYVKAVGLKEIGVVPDLLWSETKQKAIPGMILRITQEDLNEGL